MSISDPSAFSYYSKVLSWSTNQMEKELANYLARLSCPTTSLRLDSALTSYESPSLPPYRKPATVYIDGILYGPTYKGTPVSPKVLYYAMGRDVYKVTNTYTLTHHAEFATSAGALDYVKEQMQ